MKFSFPIRKEDKITVYTVNLDPVENGLKSVANKVDKIADSAGKVLKGIFSKEEYIRK